MNNSIFSINFPSPATRCRSENTRNQKTRNKKINKFKVQCTCYVITPTIHVKIMYNHQRNTQLTWYNKFNEELLISVIYRTNYKFNSTIYIQIWKVLAPFPPPQTMSFQSQETSGIEQRNNNNFNNCIYREKYLGCGSLFWFQRCGMNPRFFCIYGAVGDSNRKDLFKWRNLSVERNLICYCRHKWLNKRRVVDATTMRWSTG